MRTRTLGVCAAVVALAALPHGQAATQMAITFDDLPFGYVRHLTIDQQRDAVARVLATLRKHGVTATMFVVGQAVTNENRGLVDAVVEAGHTIGNHSFSHRDLGTIPAEDYVADIQKGGEVIAPWLKGTHYFRYPFLRQGNTAEKRDTVLG